MPRDATGIRIYVDPDKMRAARVAAYLTQAELASRAKVGLSTIERVERGDEPVGVRYATLRPVAKVLGVRLEDLQSAKVVA